MKKRVVLATRILGCAGLCVLGVMWVIGRWWPELMGSRWSWAAWIGFAAWVLVSWWVVAVVGLFGCGGVLLAARMRCVGGAAVAAGVVVLVLSTRLWRWSGASGADEATVRVMSFNTLFSNRDVDAMEAMIRREGVDVVCFQELHAEQHAALSARLADVYPWREAVTRENNRGVGIYSRLAMREVEVVTLPGPIWDAAPMSAVVETSEGAVRIVCVHLAAPQGPEYGIENLRCAERLGELARKRLLPTLVVGDHNFGEWSASHAAMGRGGLVDAFGAVGRGAGMSLEFYGLPLALCMRVDYVWLTDEMEAVSARVVEGGGSDHRAVAVAFRAKVKSDKRE